MGLRKGSEEAIRLLDSDNKVEWEAAFQSYAASIKRLSQEKGKSELVELDQWWRTELPAALVSRGATPYLLKDELVKVVQWKLWIGQMRPSLLQRAKETSANTPLVVGKDYCDLGLPTTREACVLIGVDELQDALLVLEVGVRDGEKEMSRATRREKAEEAESRRLEEQQRRLELEAELEQLQQRLAAKQPTTPLARGTPSERVPASRPSGGSSPPEEKSDDPEAADHASNTSGGDGGDDSGERDKFFGGGGRDDEEDVPPAAGREQQRDWVDEDEPEEESEVLLSPAGASIVEMLKRHHRDGTDPPEWLMSLLLPANSRKD
ncbi:unnamed protein product [Ectocarpus sp. CCAP 1310/34]|nr:unnamed protein product [Ectocarpus sp. CCAP 1310/34]